MISKYMTVKEFAMYMLALPEEQQNLYIAYNDDYRHQRVLKPEYSLPDDGPIFNEVLIAVTDNSSWDFCNCYEIRYENKLTEEQRAACVTVLSIGG